MEGEDDGDVLLGWLLQAVETLTLDTLPDLKLIDVNLSKYIFIF